MIKTARIVLSDINRVILNLLNVTTPCMTSKHLAIKYALDRFRVYMLGDIPFITYAKHAPLRKAINSSRLPKRMERWMSSFAKYNFFNKVQASRISVFDGAKSRWLAFEPAAQPHSETPTVAVLTSTIMSSPLMDDTPNAYICDPAIVNLINHLVNSFRNTLKHF